MGAPIRSSEEITTIINKGQHAIADLGLEIAREAKRGEDNTNPDFRLLVMRLVLLRAFYQNIITVDGTINNFYSAALNEKAENNILTGILKLSGIYGGPAIPKLTGDNLPVYFFPSSSGVSSGGTSGGVASPGGITFENLDVDAPGEVVDSIVASTSNYAFYIVNVYGNGVGEGSKGAVLLVTWRGASAPVVTEYGGADVGGTTAGVTFSAALVSGLIELTANVPTDNWTIRGTRISFQNISFQNPLGPMPPGGLLNQLLRKSSNLDYQTEWFTLLWQHITDVTASLTEINRVTGVTSPIQTQINNLTSALANYLLLTGGNLSGALGLGGNKITNLGAGTTNGDALRYQQVIGLYLLLTGGNLSGPLGMGSNKITGLAAATANGDAVRFEQLPVTDGLTWYELEINGWDCDTVPLFSMSLGGLDYKKIRSCRALLRSDDLGGGEFSSYDFNGGTGGGIIYFNFASLNPTTVFMSRVGGSAVDNSGFAGLGLRGWLYLGLEP